VKVANRLQLVAGSDAALTRLDKLDKEPRPTGSPKLGSQPERGSVDIFIAHMAAEVRHTDIGTRARPKLTGGLDTFLVGEPEKTTRMGRRRTTRQNHCFCRYMPC
jgi:hypothetical protein